MGRFIEWAYREMDVVLSVAVIMGLCLTMLLVAAFMHLPTKEEFYAQCERGETASFGTARAVSCSAHLLAIGRK